MDAPNSSLAGAQGLAKRTATDAEISARPHGALVARRVP
jgi:hypothetical protein